MKFINILTRYKRILGIINFLLMALSADDDNRIALKPLPDVSDCQRDYINACYVDVREFIVDFPLATQTITTTIIIEITCLCSQTYRATLFQTSSWSPKVSGHRQCHVMSYIIAT